MILEFLVYIARAGGGGSGSGGGSDGSSILAMPLIAASLTAGFVRKKTQSRVAGCIVGITVAAATSLIYIAAGWLFALIAFAGGVLGAIIAGTADAIGRFRKNSRQARVALHQASISDRAWNEQEVLQHAANMFYRFQYDWSMMDVASIQQYTTTRFSNHIGLMLYAMKEMGRTNIMETVKIDEMLVTGAHDSSDNNQDRVSVAIVASGKDTLWDTRENKSLFITNDEFGEQWNFVRSERGWLLDGIEQNTEDPNQLIPALQQFAASQGMYFSPDWGRLLLPTKGNLFKRGFAGTDINNHIIGFWTGNIIVQLYTYSFPSPYIRGEVSKFLVGQVALPKSYGGIIIRRRVNIFDRLVVPRTHKTVKLEWGDFNKQYGVYATDQDKVTSFELLNPAFMAWLCDRQMHINIEVVDNVVYLYAEVWRNEQRYAEMMEVLQKAYKELQR